MWIGQVRRPEAPAEKIIPVYGAESVFLVASYVFVRLGEQCLAAAAQRYEFRFVQPVALYGGSVAGPVEWLVTLGQGAKEAITVETFLLTYTIMQVHGRTEPWVQRWGLIPWAVIALAGIIVWTKPQISAGFRRVAAAFG